MKPEKFQELLDEIEEFIGEHNLKNPHYLFDEEIIEALQALSIGKNKVIPMRGWLEILGQEWSSLELIKNLYSFDSLTLLQIIVVGSARLQQLSFHESKFKKLILYCYFYAI